MNHGQTHTGNPEYPSFCLALDGVAVDRTGQRVFEGITAAAGNGEVLFLEGANGSGKSTLLRTIAGYLPASRGSISFELEGATLEDYRNYLLYLGHAKALKLELTLRDNSTAWYAIMAGGTLKDDRLFMALEQVGLHKHIDQPVKYFSSGQRQRAALSRFLLLDRPLWLMDEPTVGLDRTSKATLSGMIKAHMNKGGAAIIATHETLKIDGASMTLDAYKPHRGADGYWA